MRLRGVKLDAIKPNGRCISILQSFTAMRQILILVALAGFVRAAAAEDLPKALIIGDSISMGYTQPVTDALKGTAVVSRPKANCGSTVAGLANLDKWLQGGPWDVIHFNWGLHDLCYRNPESKTQGKRDKVNGKQAVPIAEYEKNLETLVKKLKETGAKLVFATTTVVPEGEAGRVVGDDDKYNAAALRVMARYGVEINDLHALSKTFGPELFVGPDNVHFKPEGSEKLAAQVADSIKAALKQRASRQ